MPWLRVDSGFWRNRKVRRAGHAARGLHASALSFCADELTDGLVDVDTLKLLDGTTKLAAVLVAAGLWETHSEGWVIHDYLEWNPSKEQVLADRARAAERQAKSRRTSRVTDTASPDVTTGVSHTTPSHTTPQVFPLTPAERGNGKLRAAGRNPRAVAEQSKADARNLRIAKAAQPDCATCHDTHWVIPEGATEAACCPDCAGAAS